MYRELAAAYPDRYRPDLARLLSNLGVALLALGRSAEALPPTEEAVTMNRELAVSLTWTAAANSDPLTPGAFQDAGRARTYG